MKLKAVYGFRLLFIAALALIIFVSVIPNPSSSIGGFDKAGHFSAYFVLSVLMFLSIKTRVNRIIALISLIAMGALLEWIQSFTPGRDMSMYDEAMNAGGLLIGGVIYWVFHEKIFKSIAVKKR